MAHTIYSNFYLSNEIEDQYASYLDLQNFCTIDNSLEGTPGMIRKINRYSATNGAQKLTMGNGNTQDITISYTDHDYTIALAQSRFKYYDEQEMTDPMLLTTGTQYMAVDMFNTVNADIFAEFNKATLNVVSATPDFGAFVDAAAKLNVESLETEGLFAFVSPAKMAAVRKALKDDLKYVEAFAKQGYVGTCAGINLYVKKNAGNNIVVATPKAVTLFNKRGVEVEQERDANTRENRIFCRKYYVAALTDATKAVLIKPSAT